jgi:prepilin-type N-terminal cleavage/methylation domain-containing protein/prepilin-type processing-associated H-X9-DG protein
MRSRRGFTLIEMLVVIAIIAILAAILFPVFSRARAKARQAGCMSNIQQVGMAILLYAQDHGEILPAWCFGTLSGNDNGPAQGAYTWDTVIQPYMKNIQILTCPDSPYGRTVTEKNGGTMALRSYAMPRYVSDPKGTFRPGGTCDYPCPVDWPTVPVDTILVMEKGKRGLGIVGDAAAENAAQSHSASTQAGYAADLYHNGGKNFCFLDGHVKWFPAGDGPFAALIDLAGNGLTEPPTGMVGAAYEPHAPGHCEFDSDWPRNN